VTNSSSVLTTSSSLPPAKVLLPHLTLEVQTIRLGSKITVQGKLLGCGRSQLHRQIDSYFPPPEEAKPPAADDLSKPTQETMPGLHPDLTIMSWNARSADPFAQPSRLAQLSETLADHKVGILSIQEIRFSSIHVKGFVTAPFPFTRGSQGTTLLVHESLAWKKNTRLRRLLRHIPGIEAQIIDIFTPSTTCSVGAFYIHPSSPAEYLSQALLIAMENGLSLYGDFNAKGQFNLQGNHSNGLGRMADKIFLEFPTCQIAFPDVPTFLRPGAVEDYEATLDGAISGDLQADIIVLRLLDELDSDHNPVFFQHLPPSPPLRLNLVASPPKFKVSLVNTPSFHKELSGLERLIKLPRTPQELDAIANFTAESLRTATSRSTAPPQSKASRLPFWDDEFQSLRKAKIRARRRRGSTASSPVASSIAPGPRRRRGKPGYVPTSTPVQPTNYHMVPPPRNRALPETVRLSVTSRRPRCRPNRSPPIFHQRCPWLEDGSRLPRHIQGLRSSQRRHPPQRPCRPIQPPSIRSVAGSNPGSPTAQLQPGFAQSRHFPNRSDSDCPKAPPFPCCCSKSTSTTSPPTTKTCSLWTTAA